MSGEYFYKLGCVYMKHKLKASKKLGLRRFRAFFGVTPTVCLRVWNLIIRELPIGSKPKHLLWCLNYLKQYSTEHMRRTIFNADEKSIRKWTLIFIQHLADLTVVCSIAGIVY